MKQSGMLPAVLSKMQESALDQPKPSLYSMPAMKTALSLSASARAKTENLKSMRKAGDVPGVVYGGKTENMTIKCSLKELHNVYVKAGENTLVEVMVGDKKIPCLIHSISFEPVSGREEHVDLYAVDMTKKVTTRVPIVAEGESPAVKSQGGVLVTVHDEVEVTCLPSDIPKSFVVNIAVLENFRDSITMAQLKVPSGVTIKSSAETVIFTVQEPRKEEVIEVVAPTTEGDAAAAPGAEGAAAAPAAGAPAAGAKADDKAAAGKDKAPAKK